MTNPGTKSPGARDIELKGVVMAVLHENIQMLSSLIEDKLSSYEGVDSQMHRLRAMLTMQLREAGRLLQKLHSSYLLT